MREHLTEKSNNKNLNLKEMLIKMHTNGDIPDDLFNKISETIEKGLGA